MSAPGHGVLGSTGKSQASTFSSFTFLFRVSNTFSAPAYPNGVQITEGTLVSPDNPWLQSTYCRVSANIKLISYEAEKLLGFGNFKLHVYPFIQV